MENIRNIIESLLFVSDEPLTVDKLKSVIETVDAKEVRASLNTLADQYEARGGGFRLCEVAGGWQLRSRSQYNEYIKRMLQPSPQRLSRPALETLAIVAYNQPIIRADIEHIRGVDCGGMLRQLLERKLIRVLGRKEIPGRPLIYATSKLFLELFELKNLKDLPTPKEIEEISGPANNVQDNPRSAPAQDMAGTSSDQSPASVNPGATTQIPVGQDNALISSPPAPGPGYRRMSQKTTTTVNPASNSGYTFAGAPRISTDPSKINAVPSSISSTPVKITLNNEANSSPISMETCGATQRKNDNGTATQLRANRLKKP